MDILDTNLGGLDYAVVLVYGVVLIALGRVWGRTQQGRVGHYLAGRNLHWLTLGLSAAATQTSAIGFLSVPAFVAARSDGGLKILTNELPLPIAILFIAAFLAPRFRSMELISVYDFLGRRFSPAVRTLVSAVYLVSRLLGTAVGLYMTATVLAVLLDCSLALAIIMIGAVTVIYDVLGGMKAVVYTDVIQLIALLLSAVIIISSVIVDLGGISHVAGSFAAVSPDRFVILDFDRLGFGDGGDYAFWPQFIGGFVLLCSYYGCDQTQVQRQLSAATLPDVVKSLFVSALFRFPLSLLYCTIGLVLAAKLAQQGDFHRLYNTAGVPDHLVPLYVLYAIPEGLKGFIFVGILAAAMSSLDSSINSLSAVVQTDWIDAFSQRKGGGQRGHRATHPRLVTAIVGALVTCLAFGMGGHADTIVETIAWVASAFAGPMLAAFVCGILLSRIGGHAIMAGVIFGLIANLGLMLSASAVHFIWWNVVGFVSTTLIALSMSLFVPVTRPGSLACSRRVMETPAMPEGSVSLGWIVGLLGYTLALIFFCHLVPQLLR